MNVENINSAFLPVLSVSKHAVKVPNTLTTPKHEVVKKPFIAEANGHEQIKLKWAKKYI